jgi:hypothetical protein
MIFCKSSGNNPAHQFAGAGKPIALGEGGQRDRSAVTRDVAALGKAGLVTVTEKTHPGHGRMKEVRARAKAIKIEALVV